MDTVSDPALTHLTLPAPAKDSGAGWHDFEDIRRILASYTHLLDQAFAIGQPPDVMHLYHPECVFSVSFEPGAQVGHEAIVAWYRRFFGKRGGYYRWSRHKIAEPAITVDGETASSTTYWDADCVDRNDLVRTMAGRYDDTFVKESGVWLINRRHTWIYYHYASGKAKEYGGWN